MVRTEQKTHRVITWTNEDGIIQVSPDMTETEAFELAKLGESSNDENVFFTVESL